MKNFFIVFILTIILISFGNKIVYADEENICGFANASDKQWSRCCTVVASDAIRESIKKQREKTAKLGDWWCKLWGSCFSEEDENKVYEAIESDAYLQSILPCQTGSPSTSNSFDKACTCVQTKEVEKTNFLCDRHLTKDVKNFKKADYDSCTQCFTAKGFWTGLGCFYVGSWKDFFEKNVFGFMIGLAGLMAFFCIIYSAFLMQTSSGNPEKVKNAQAMLTSCIMGLILIIFSVVILKIIGVDILKIPGFQ